MCRYKFVSLKIKDSRWLQGVKWPLPDKNYRSLPRTTFSNGSMENRDINSFNAIDAQNKDNVNEHVEGATTKEKGIQNICDKNEFVVRNEMESLGISSEFINSHIERGARSPIIGTYRILLHR